MTLRTHIFKYVMITYCGKKRDSDQKRALLEHGILYLDFKTNAY